ncbi:glycosyltransferase family protein [Chlorobium phaeobacteroides]|uniref:Uncharacterized protein n=1 Tax=Chlorobium phaeobacteroides (strain DSM 266 / SMG 266 / 2430) TaxID=290317 RepID=A1BEM1_CHLPD|nr:hypothetical protein [Chlorobium phaeobacteroides]ABL64848.1 hypothetical protein Cpha266_0797 [Chlorobium phaeobacteroides DSM 266]
MMMLSRVYEKMQDDFDITHAHLEYLTLPNACKTRTPTVLTMHGRLDQGDSPTMLRLYRDMASVSISNSRRRPLENINRINTIHHGYPAFSFELNEHPVDYVLNPGRFSEEKKPDQAIMLAKECNMPLKNAKALLNTINRPEPFGLVMIVALACGTPVIVRGCGSGSDHAWKKRVSIFRFCSEWGQLLPAKYCWFTATAVNKSNDDSSLSGLTSLIVNILNITSCANTR